MSASDRMDFGLDADQQAAVGLAAQILGDRATPERLKTLEAERDAGGDGVDRLLWADLVRADLVGLCLPEAHGGGGYGLVEACLLCTEVGRAVAPIPLWPVLAAGVWLAESTAVGSAAAVWPARIAAGEGLVVPALTEAGADAHQPAVTATRDGETLVLGGAKTVIVGGLAADALLVPVQLDGDLAVVLVEVEAAGIVAERQDSFSHEPLARVVLDGVRVPAGNVVATGASALRRLIDLWVVLGCAVAAGVADRGLRLTAQYATERHQFDRPIATFQAVGQRMADGYVDTEAIRLTMLQAATALAEPGSRSAATVEVAAYWAATAGSRVGHTCLHVHGGISIDVDYPIHRYFLWAKQLEAALGGGSARLAGLGDLLAG